MGQSWFRILPGGLNLHSTLIPSVLLPSVLLPSILYLGLLYQLGYQKMLNIKDFSGHIIIRRWDQNSVSEVGTLSGGSRNIEMGGTVCKIVTG